MSVRKVIVSRPSPKESSQKNFIKSNLENVKDASKNKKIPSISLGTDKKEFRVENLKQLKTKYQLKKEIEQEFLEIQKKDLKLQKLEKIFRLENMNRNMNRKEGKRGKKEIRNSPGKLKQVSLKGTPFKENTLKEIALKKLHSALKETQITKKENETHADQVQSEITKNEYQITLKENQITKTENLAQEITIKENDEISDISLDLQDSSDISLKEITLKEMCLKVEASVLKSPSTTILENIIQGKEEFYLNGNYLKKFGIYGGGKEKFWELLGIIAREIINEILEIQVQDVVEICDEMVQDLIKEELQEKIGVY